MAFKDYLDKVAIATQKILGTNDKLVAKEIPNLLINSGKIIKKEIEKEIEPSKTLQEVVPTNSKNQSLSKVVVKEIPNKYIIPTGEKTITKNGTYDIKNYDKANIEIINLTQIQSALISGKLTHIENEKCTKISMRVFEGYSSLESIYFPKVTRVDSYAFKNCKSLKSINNSFSKGFNFIGFNSFEGCDSLEEVIFGEEYYNLRYLTGNDICIFKNCVNLKKVVFSNVIQVGSGVFENCTNLISVDLPKAQTIYDAFRSCTSLKSIKFPVCYELLNAVFMNCSSLTDVYLGYNGVVRISLTTIFYKCPNVINIHVRPEYTDQYATAQYWSSLIADGSITIVGDYSD